MDKRQTCHISLIKKATYSIIFTALLCACSRSTPVKKAETAPLAPIENAILVETNRPQSQDNTPTSATLSETPSKTPTGSSKTPVREDLWERIRQGYGFSDTTLASQNRLIDSYLRRYRKHPQDILRQTQQSAPYLHYIVDQLEKNNMPTELALLPFVESRYDPFAYSSGRASGLWQFVPATARRFHLQTTWWHDERRDIIASTQAAIAYFRYLHQYFNQDWLLAIAAYNAGEGTVGKAIRRNRKRGKAIDYWSLALPKETRHYIPKLLAWSKIVRSPARYQITLAPVANQPYFAEIDVASQIDLAHLAKAASLDIETIYALNPAYNRWATDPNPPHTLLVPRKSASAIKRSLQQYPTDQRISWKRYIIKPKDSLSLIAQRFKTTVSAIKDVNQLSSSTIRRGSTLLIPTASQPADYYSNSHGQRLAKRQNTPRGKSKTRIEHTVAHGESLWSIAKKYGTNSASIARWNNMSTKDLLRKHRKLVIWLGPAHTI